MLTRELRSARAAWADFVSYLGGSLYMLRSAKSRPSLYCERSADRNKRNPIEWQRILQTNLVGVLEVTYQVLPAYAQSGQGTHRQYGFARR